jgi:hypothetical protein
MSKYDPVWEYLKKKKGKAITLSFDEIKTILGFPIDHSFLNYKKEAAAYGYTVKKIYLKDKKIDFVSIT